MINESLGGGGLAKKKKEISFIRRKTYTHSNISPLSIIPLWKIASETVLLPVGMVVLPVKQ
jgi:hypothetical protein